MPDPTPAPALTDEQIDIVADAFNAHPMLLGYGEADRLLIAGALAIAAVRALDLAAVIARTKREERERIAAEVRQRATEVWPVDVFPRMDTPDWEVINAAIRQAGYTSDRISAHVMRYAFYVAAVEIEDTDD